MRRLSVLLNSKSPALFAPATVLLLCAWVTPSLRGQQDVHATPKREAERKAAPGFQLVTAEGKRVQVSDYRGRVVLLNFWATDCGGCVLEIPSFIEIQKENIGQSYTALGVAMDISYEGLKDANEAWGRVRPFMAKHEVNYPIAMGNDAVSKAYALNAFPDTYLIDKSGRIAVVYEGVVIDKKNVEANIKTLLAER